jgi:hypothetical protein
MTAKLLAAICIGTTISIASACGASPPAWGASPPAGNVLGLTVTSPHLKAGQMIPRDFTGDGRDMSPELHWNALPQTTKSIVVMCYDPDAPRGTWYHWLLWNLPAATKELKDNVPKTSSIPGGAVQGTNDFDKVGYNGPAPPKGQTHHYHYRVMALDTSLNVKPGARKNELLNAIKGHIKADGELVSIYYRR